MVANKDPFERKQERGSLLVGRDKASSETVVLLNTLRDSISDPDAATAVATLHAQINGDHPDYTRPPEREPFGHWHRTLTIADPVVTTTTDTSITIDASVTAFDYYDGDVEVYARVSRADADPTTSAVESSTKTVPTADTVSVGVDGLDPQADYRVQIVAEAPHLTGTDTVHSDTITATTGG